MKIWIKKEMKFSFIYSTDRKMKKSSCSWHIQFMHISWNLWPTLTPCSFTTHLLLICCSFKALLEVIEEHLCPKISLFLFRFMKIEKPNWKWAGSQIKCATNCSYFVHMFFNGKSVFWRSCLSQALIMNVCPPWILLVLTL